MIIGYTHVGYNELVVGVEGLPLQFGLVGGADLSAKKDRMKSLFHYLLTYPSMGNLFVIKILQCLGDTDPQSV